MELLLKILEPQPVATLAVVEKNANETETQDDPADDVVLGEVPHEVRVDEELRELVDVRLYRVHLECVNAVHRDSQVTGVQYSNVE